MKKLKIPLILLTLIALLVTPAFGWGGKGHQTVGRIAQLHLANTNTSTRIRQILRQNETLASISTWADTVKDVEVSADATSADADTQHFLRNLSNRGNRNWHFVDMPLDCQSYNAQNCAAFTSNRDIVHVINLCIRKLQGGNVPNLTNRNALRMLVHLVGDLHQPLHVGVGFIDENEDNGTIQIIRNPATVISRHLEDKHDLGGNRLLFSENTRDNLHSLWDSKLVSDVSDNQSVSAFAADLKTDIPPENSWNATGAANTWAAQWATDSIGVSRTRAYDTIGIRREIFFDEKPFYIITSSDNYRRNNEPVVKAQLAKGGFRLARLLRAILP
jgi:hypothetical protein